MRALARYCPSLPLLLLLLSAFSVAATTLHRENTLNHQQLPRYARSQP